MSSYRTKMGLFPDVIATAKNQQLHDPNAGFSHRRTIVKNGLVVDPANNIEQVMDLAISQDRIVQVADEITPESGDIVINAQDLLVFPGLIYMHLHLGDLFEVSTNPIYGAAAGGVTVVISPGAGNTLVAPSLLGAEVDRSLPTNVGVYLGAAGVVGLRASTEELIQYFRVNYRRT